MLLQCRAVIDTRPLTHAITSLTHAYDTMADRTVAEGVIGPALHRLESVRARIEAHHEEMKAAVAEASVSVNAELARYASQLRRAEAALQAARQHLGPGNGAEADVAKAIDALHEYGITYQADDPEDPEA